MKKIINGKLYNTDTAERVGAWDNGHYTNDFSYCSENLFKKRTGEFFLHGEGGPMSRYAQSSGNSTGWGQTIKPLTYQEAMEWAEKKLSGDDYIAIFGEPVEDDSLTALNLTLSAASVNKFRLTAQQEQISQRALMERLIDTL